MFSRLRQFARRHSRKFLVAGALFAAGYAVKKFAEYKLRQWQEREVNEILERARKQQHFQSTEQTCNLTATSLSAKLQTSVARALDSDQITLLLKSGAPNKVELWERLKIVAFARVISFAYGHVMLVTLLRTQLNILGAYMYCSTSRPGDESLELGPELQNQYLSACHRLLGEGIESFCDVVEKVTTEQVGSVSLKDKLTLTDLERIFHDIRISMENEISQRPTSYLAGFMLDCPAASSTTQSLLNRMFMETQEVLEAEETRTLISNCVNVGITHVLDQLTGYFATQATADKANDFVHPNRVEVFVAKLIPVLSNTLHGGAWIQQLVKLEPLRNFGANIYEAFSAA